MNLLSDTIKDYHTLNDIKNCQEVKFSNGGHYFACADGQFKVHVFNFYTGEAPAYMQTKGHGRIRSIEWYADDSGFQTADSSGMVCFFDLQDMKRNPGMRTFDFSKKGYQFTGSCLIPDKKHDCIAVGPGPDNCLWSA